MEGVGKGETGSTISSDLTAYGVVPNGLLTFLGSLYKEGAKTPPGTLVYHFERQTSRKNFLPSKNTVSTN